ncbi:MAG: hypothetical protein WA947_00080 [Phormidesmis sp.]
MSLWLRPAVADSSLSESRINQLEFKVRSLQTQISQLQGQSPSLSSGNATSRPETALPMNELSSGEQFDNLATLVIEINQRVIRLEEAASASSN